MHEVGALGASIRVHEREILAHDKRLGPRFFARKAVSLELEDVGVGAQPSALERRRNRIVMIWPEPNIEDEVEVRLLTKPLQQNRERRQASIFFEQMMIERELDRERSAESRQPLFEPIFLARQNDSVGAQDKSRATRLGTRRRDHLPKFGMQRGLASFELCFEGTMRGKALTKIRKRQKGCPEWRRARAAPWARAIAMVSERVIDTMRARRARVVER